MTAHPFGLTNVATIYQNATQDCFTNQIGCGHDLPRSDLPKVDQVLLVVNMV
jgi:hypothetical protein